MAQNENGFDTHAPWDGMSLKPDYNDRISKVDRFIYSLSQREEIKDLTLLFTSNC